jgi:hypothetical protein
MTACGRFGEAEPLYERSFAMLVASHGERHPEIAGARVSRAVHETARGRPLLALEQLTRALALLDDPEVDDSPQLVDLAHELGRALVDAGQPADGLQWLELARVRAEHEHRSELLLAPLLLDLAATLASIDVEPEHVRALAGRAHVAFASAGCTPRLVARALVYAQGGRDPERSLRPPDRPASLGPVPRP